MEKPKKPEDEFQRLSALLSYEILDTLEEPEYDQLTELAGYICKTPVALMSLIEDERQWFKSKVGTTISSTPRELSFCGHAIYNKQPLTVKDARLDERFHDNPLVAGEPNIVFYSGIPLIDLEGYAIGTLCVMDYTPRELTIEQRKSLAIIAQQIITNLTLRRKNLKNQNYLNEFSKLTSQVPGVIYQFRMHPDGKNYFPFATPALQEIYEYTFEEVSKDASHTMQRIHPEDLDRARNSMLHSMDTLTDWKLDYRVNLPKKGERWLRVRSRPEKLPDGSIQWNGFIFDVTEEKHLENLAKHQSKLSILGEIAAGVAHEVNNPLTIISGTIKLLNSYIKNPEQLNQKIQTIEKNISRIAKIVSSLNKFSRQNQSQDFKIISLSKAIDEAIVLTHGKAIRDGVKIEFDKSNQWLILGDEIEIEQVFVNLINNAIDAIRTRSEKWIKILIVEVDENVVVRTYDSGPGISKDVAEKIFQPFFTTKPAGLGTGLGLSIVKGILDTIGAQIEVRSEEPNTCFEIRFKKSLQTLAN